MPTGKSPLIPLLRKGEGTNSTSSSNSTHSLLLVMAMEMCCVLLWLKVFDRGLGIGYLSVALMLAAYALPLVARLITPGRRGESKAGRAVNAALAVAGIAAIGVMAAGRVSSGEYPIDGWAGPPGIGLQMGLAAVVWWVGNSLLRQELGYTRVCARFQICVLSILALSLVNRDLFLPVIPFFVLSFLALAATRWQTLVSRTGTVLRRGRVWPVVAGTAFVLLPAVLLVLVLSPEMASVLAGWFWSGSFNVVHFLGLDRPPAPSSSPLPFGLSCLAARSKGISQAIPASPPSKDLTLHISPFIVIGVAMAIYVAVITWIVLTNRKNKKRPVTSPVLPAGVEIISLPASMMKGLVGLMRKAGRELWRCVLAVYHLGRRSSGKAASGADDVTSVRGAYLSLLDWASRQGLPRAPWQTPFEYLDLLLARFPDTRREMAIITDAYVQVRYSRGGAEEGDLKAVDGAWRLIESCQDNRCHQETGN